MRIDGPRNLEPTAELSGSFSGSFLGKFTNRVADAQLSGSFSGSFFGRASGSFSGSFAGNGAQLDNVFKRIVVAPNDVTSILDAQNTGAIIFTSESGAGLRITQHQVAQSAPEIVFNLVDIPNSSLANSTISGIELGQNLGALGLGTGLKYTTGEFYNGSTARSINLDPTDFSDISAASLASTDKFVLGHSAAAKLLSVADFVDTLPGTGLSSLNGQLSLSNDQLFSSVLNSSGLTVGASSNTNIEFSDDGGSGQIIAKVAGNTIFSISGFVVGTNQISLSSGVSIDGIGNTNIKDFKSVSATSASFQTIQGKWRGVPGSDHSQVENWTRGLPMCFVGERSRTIQENKTFAFGNGGDGDGIAMPFAGRVLAVTIGYAGPMEDTSGDNITSVIFRMTKNGNEVGTANNAGARVTITNGTSDGHGTNTSMTSAGSQVVTGITDPATNFAAGDRINWKCTSITADGSGFNGEIEQVVTLAFWVMFD